MLPETINKTGHRHAAKNTSHLAGLAAAIVIATATVHLTGAMHARPTTLHAASQPMTAVTATPLHATATLARRTWGTQISLDCRYSPTTNWPAAAAASVTYTLVVVDRAGHSHQLGSWTLAPAHEVHYLSGTALPMPQIRTVQITTARGAPLLQLRRP